MALSVSGFPEPSRHAGSSSEVFTGDNSMQDGFGKAGLMNSPRLRGLFGASNSSSAPSSSKRPDTKNLATTSKQDAEASGGFGITVGLDESSQSSSATATTPPTTPSLSFSTSSFEPLSQAEYELELQIPPMAALPPLEAPRPSGAKRPGLPPLPRKTTQSPVRLGPNLSRLEIAGSWARSPPTLHPKPLPPSVVVQEWSNAKVNIGADVALSTSPPQQPRPLPSVPGNTVEPTKQVSNPVPGPSRHPNAIPTVTAPVAGPSRHVNAIAGSSKHVNAVGGSSKHANAVAGSSKHPGALSVPASSPTASTSSSPPTSKVIIAQTTTLSQPTHKNTPSLSMRYQPLVAEPAPESSASASSSSSKNSNSDANATTNPSNTVLISSPVRPLPRIPPTTGTAASTSAVSANVALVNVSATTPSSSSSSNSTSNSQLRAGLSATDPSSSEQFIPPARVKRPKTSPSPITGFALPSPAASSSASPSTGKTTATTTSSISIHSSSAASVLTSTSANNLTAFSRSPFDNITTSWASRASELNVKGKVLPARAHPHARRANSPPLPVGGGTKLLPPRARSHSRPRRDRSLDSFYASSNSTSKPPSRVSSPVTTAFGINQFPSGGAGGISSPTGARSPRSLASPTIGGARPITKKSATLPANKGLHIQTSTATLAFGTGKTFTGSSHGGSTWIVSPSGGKRSQPPSPPSGPIKPRARPSPMNSPTIHAPVPSSRVLPKILVDAAVLPSIPAVPKAVATSQSTVIDVTTTTQAKHKGTTVLDLHSILETQSIDSGMHNHPIEALTDDGDSIAQRPISPTGTTIESPIEAFVDDQDFSTLSRSPSPIRYARPDSVGIFTDSDDEMTYAAYASSSSSASSRDSSPNPAQRRKRNQQLRSYRNSYRPRSGRSSPPYIPYERPRSPSPVHEIPAAEDNSNRNSQKSSKKKKAKSSYFGGGGGGLSTLSTPGTRASSPERKSRSRQPRRLAEAVSSALEEVRNRGRVASTSPKRKVKAGASFTSTGGGSGGLTGNGHLQVENNTTGGQIVDDMDVLDISLPSLSRRQTDGTIDTRSSISDNQTGNSSARSSAKVGWAKVIGRKRSEIGELSSSASGSAAQLNADQNDLTETWPRKLSHRRVDSLDGGVGGGTNNNSQEQDLDDEQYRAGGITLSKIETTITSTVTVTRPPSSSVSTPFSGFSITGKSKKKRAMSVTTPSTGNTTDGFSDRPALIIHKTYEGHDGNDIKDMGGWVDLTNADEEGDRNDDLTGDRRALIEEGGEVVVVTTKRVMRGVDGDGDVWEHEQETGVADIIPHLRNLKASRS